MLGGLELTASRAALVLDTHLTTHYLWAPRGNISYLTFGKVPKPSADKRRCGIVFKPVSRRIPGKPKKQ